MKESNELKCRNLEKELINIYKELHQYPELSHEEVETTKKIKKLLGSAEIEVINLPLNTGLVAQITGKKDFPVIAIRCDIDALPINEETEIEYKSERPDKMHACGHDFHTTAVLGAALLLKEKQKELNGTVKIIFQPAEEISQGANLIINTKVLADVNAIFGIHASPNLSVGEVGIKEGAVTSAVDRFEIEVCGKGTHAAQPHLGIDPIVVSAHIITALQTIISRNVDPFDTALLSITNLHSGNTWNVIPTTAYMEGTVRTLNPKTREFIPKRMKAIAEQIAGAFDATVTFTWFPTAPATNNTTEWVEFSKDIAIKNGLKVKPYAATLIGEDFAFYQELMSGTFIFVGTDQSYPLHHPKFMINTDAILVSSRYLAELAENAMNVVLNQ